MQSRQTNAGGMAKEGTSRHCEEQQRQSGRGDEAIPYIGLILSILGDCFVALPAAQDTLLLLAMTIFSRNDGHSRQWWPFLVSV
ncbi:hypothetical protein [Chitinophaga sp. YIM B06452]|uniref:hypothetical protein n=1 Tax=Chitinophaga sp. YIM B06452 TaxID=3082158 RepID=UPI0031FE8CB3